MFTNSKIDINLILMNNNFGTIIFSCISCLIGTALTGTYLILLLYNQEGKIELCKWEIVNTWGINGKHHTKT